MIIKDRIIRYLQQNPDGVDDDELARRLQLGYRQQANARCRELEREGLLERRKVSGKIQNFWIGPRLSSRNVSASLIAAGREWFWEGNVQAKVVGRLVNSGYDILSVADTERRERGKDIMAIKSGNPIWVTVKGFPTGTDRTHPSTQAGHWFKQEIFDIVEYRSESPTAELAIGLPDFPRYRNLASKILWFKEASKFAFYWVRQDGSVSVE